MIFHYRNTLSICINLAGAAVLATSFDHVYWHHFSLGILRHKRNKISLGAHNARICYALYGWLNPVFDHSNVNSAAHWPLDGFGGSADIDNKLDSSWHHVQSPSGQR